MNPIKGSRGGKGKDRAILMCYTGSLSKKMKHSRTRRTRKSADVIVVDKKSRKEKKSTINTFLEKETEEVLLNSLHLGADIIIFNQSLNPSQIRSICKATDLKVIDRSMLILDIFAQRAKNREGKVQVELAMLKYRLPRLVEKDDSLSRLTGGIGGRRGPGETKLEENRRAVREKKLKAQKKQIETFRKQHQQKRARRIANNMPIVSLVGYTNAGKSTLLNSL
jgi:GTP-binding protein HflX